MALEQIKQVTGQGVPVPGDDIDTDQIIPARFMKCITFDGLGEYYFYDVRKNEDGTDKPHILNDPRFADATIIISGKNFGCGSSREHAPQALYKAGFRAVIAESFAEIFFGNCTQLGIPCVTVSHEAVQDMRAALQQSPQAQIIVDVEHKRITFGQSEVGCDIPNGARSSLLNGTWDPITELIEGADEVEQTMKGLAYTQATA